MKNTGNKGITLIALVITIIVLLILAGVSIAMLTGENGILNQANQAKEETELAEEEELLRLAYNEYRILKAAGETGDPSVAGADVDSTADGWRVTFKESGNVYKLGKDGAITDGTIEYDTVPDDFWVVTSGTLTINPDYLSPVAYNGNYASYSNATDKVENVYECKDSDGKEYKNLIIPTTVNGTKITKLNAYMPNLINVENVKIESGITEIGFQAFARWTSLESVEIPSTVTVIGKGAFAGCVSLDNVEIPNSVTDIYGHAFYYCTSLEDITIPDSVKNIGSEAIWTWQRPGTTISYSALPNGVFGYCINLKNIYIPNSVEKIGNTMYTNPSDTPGKIFVGCSDDLQIYTNSTSTYNWSTGWNNNGLVDLNVNYDYTREAYESKIAE